jgi:hypothetical protein
LQRGVQEKVQETQNQVRKVTNTTKKGKNEKSVCQVSKQPQVKARW